MAVPVRKAVEQVTGVLYMSSTGLRQPPRKVGSAAVLLTDLGFKRTLRTAVRTFCVVMASPVPSGGSRTVDADTSDSGLDMEQDSTGQFEHSGSVMVLVSPLPGNPSDKG